MKKLEVRSLIALLLAAVMLFAMAACGDSSDTEPPVSVETDPVETDPIETDPTETDPVETDPVETEPAETDPAETDPKYDPIETDPVETKPAETEPKETECAHSYGGGKVVIPTCQAGGYTEYTCVKCGETKQENPTSKVSCNYTLVVLVPPTCNDAGSAVEQCIYCGATQNEVALEPAGHKSVTETVDVCTQVYHKAAITSCSECGYVGEAVGTEEHVFTLVETVADSETVGGTVTYGFELWKCDCGYLLKVGANHASGHFYCIDELTGKYVCKCGSNLVGDLADQGNGNPNAGPVYKLD